MFRRRARTTSHGSVGAAVGETRKDVLACDPLQALVAERLTAVTDELSAIAGAASLCSLSRSGGRVDGAKYLEGRLAALMEVRRRSATTDAWAALDAAALDWRHELDRVRGADRGPDWIAYRAGGVDELDELRLRLGPSATRLRSPDDDDPPV